jgi:hypothetical protein
MEVGWACAGVVVFGVITTLFSAMAREEGGKAWTEAANQLGLKQSQSNGRPQRHLEGEFAGFSVTVEERVKTRGDSRSTTTHVTVNAPQTTSLGHFHIRRDDAWQRGITKIFQKEELLVHDRAFDEQAYIEGAETTVLALLNQETRQAILRLFQLGSAEVKGGKVCAQRGEVAESTVLVSMVRAAVAVAERLKPLPPKQVPLALASNARTDSNSWVRLRNLRSLVESFPQHQETLQTRQAALGDPDPGVRLFAATHVRKEQALAPLRELVEKEANPAEVRLAALEHLLAKFRYEQVAPSVAVALGAVDEQVRIAAVKTVGAKRDLAMLERVCAMIAGSRERLAWSIAKTLGELGDPKAEPTLRKLLSYDSKEVKAAAEHALGQVGAVQKNQDR